MESMYAKFAREHPMGEDEQLKDYLERFLGWLVERGDIHWDDPQYQLLMEVAKHRKEQDEKWGPASAGCGAMRTPLEAFLVLAEQVGQVASRGILEWNPDALRIELIHVAGVAVAMLEALDGWKDLTWRRGHHHGH